MPGDVDVKALRKRLGYSQSQFSRRFGFAVDAVQDWEQHRRTPDGPRAECTTEARRHGAGLRDGERPEPRAA